MIEAILIVLVACLLGRGVLRVLYRRTLPPDLNYADSVLVGGMIIIGLAEAAHMGAVVSERPFSDCVRLFAIGLVLLLLVSVVMLALGQRLERYHKLSVGEFQGFLLIFGLMVLLQLLLIVTEQRVYLTGDMTAETVNSMLTTDGIYQVNPLTGQAYTEGIPLRLKLLCLPTLYAIVCDIFGLGATQVVWTLVPVLVLLGSYLAFSTVAKALFPEEGRKRSIFMVIVALLLWVGDYLYGMDGFALQYAGFRGVSIRMTILLPYTFGLVLRKKWRLVPLCILAEACIVWTLYGMGACLLAAVGMLLVEILQKRMLLKHNPDTDYGKEGNL